MELTYDELKEMLSCGMEYDFSYMNDKYSIGSDLKNNKKAVWCFNSSDYKIQTFDSLEKLLHNAHIEGKLLPDIWDDIIVKNKKTYDELIKEHFKIQGAIYAFDYNNKGYSICYSVMESDIEWRLSNENFREFKNAQELFKNAKIGEQLLSEIIDLTYEQLKQKLDNERIYYFYYRNESYTIYYRNLIPEAEKPCYIKKQEYQTFDNCDEFLSKATINGKLLSEVWNECEIY